jgi:GAF domain-containing protein
MPGDERTHDTDVLERVDELRLALTDLAKVLDLEEELGRVLQRSIDQVLGAIPGAEMASVSVLRGDAAETVASSDERVWAIDSDQYAAGEGPCLEAARSGEIVRVGVEQVRERWPRFAGSARGAGVASYLSAPLVLEDKFAGSLNLYSTQPHGFGDLDEALLRLYITAASAAIANARRYTQARAVAQNLSRALESRAVIDQARGVLMAVRGISAQEALDQMIAESQNTNTKLRDIAGQVIRSVGRRTV